MNSGVQQQLVFWRNQEIERGNLAAARNHEQTWGALIDLLDEYSLIYGESEFDWHLFQEIITSGLENLSYGKIPTAIDQVRINRLELVRSNQANRGAKRICNDCGRTNFRCKAASRPTV